MATQKDNTTPPDASKKGFFNSGWADLGTVVATATAGVLGAWATLGKSFWSNAVKDNLHSHLTGPRQAARAAALEHAQHTPDKTGGAELIKELEKIEQGYEKNKLALLQKLDLDTPLRRLNYLRAHQKWEVLGAGMASAAVALGVATTLVGFKRASTKQDNLERELHDNRELGR